MIFLIESVMILAGLSVAIIGFCRGKKWLAAFGISFVLSVFVAMFALQGKASIF